jgi:hypothetical protein
MLLSVGSKLQTVPQILIFPDPDPNSDPDPDPDPDPNPDPHPDPEEQTLTSVIQF